MRDGFNQAVTIIRNAGINTTLVIDAVGYGQDINNASNIKAYAASMINADPQKTYYFLSIVLRMEKRRRYIPAHCNGCVPTKFIYSW
jgi:hypothetical protein